MSRNRHLAWALAGAAVAVATHGAASAPPAVAQSRPNIAAAASSPSSAGLPRRGPAAHGGIDESDAAPDIAGPIPSDDPSREPDLREDDLRVGFQNRDDEVPFPVFDTEACHDGSAFRRVSRSRSNA